MCAWLSSSAAQYVAIRDDSGLRSLSNTERQFVRDCALGIVDHGGTSSTSRRQQPQAAAATDQRRRRSPLRTDGRRWDQVRTPRIQLLRADNMATSTVLWGGTGTTTRVTSTCVGEIVAPPNLDRPNEGTVQLSVDLSPMASTSFRPSAPSLAGSAGAGAGAGGRQQQTPRGGGFSFLQPEEGQKLLTNRIMRCLERILFMGGALDVEALCIKPDRYVWKLHISITVLDAAAGSILDACVMACMASIRHYRRPHVEFLHSADSGNHTSGHGDSSHGGTSDNRIVPPPSLIPADIKEPTPIPLHHTPLTISFALIPHEDLMRSSTMAIGGSGNSTMNTQTIAALIDPTAREELVMTGCFTMAINVHGEICYMDYGGGCEVPFHQVRDLYKAASTAVTALCQSLENTLQDAHEQAVEERLRRLQQHYHLQQRNSMGNLPSTMVDSNLEKVLDGIPYHVSTKMGDDLIQIKSPLSTTVVDQNSDLSTMTESQRVVLAAEEEYRHQALDYNVGHMITKVRDNNEKRNSHHPNTTTNPRNIQQQANALLLSMLQSAPSKSGDSSNRAKVVVEPMIVDDMATTMAPSNTTTPMLISLSTQSTELTHSMENNVIQQLSTEGSHSTTSEIPVAVSISMTIYSDEEDTTMQLESEFQTSLKNSIPQKQKQSYKEQSNGVADANNNDDDDDIEDLSAAIKKKPSTTKGRMRNQK